jgi:hypothetical protein
VYSPARRSSDVQATRDFAAIHGNCTGIVDLSAVEEVDVDIAYLRAFGGSPRVMAGAQRVIVAPKDEVFGVVRLYGLASIGQPGRGTDGGA